MGLIGRAGARGPGGYFAGKDLRRQDELADIELQRIRMEEQKKLDFAQDEMFWNAVNPTSAPTGIVGKDEVNPIPEFGPIPQQKGSQGGRPYGWEEDQWIHQMGDFDEWSIGDADTRKIGVTSKPKDPLTFTEIDTHTITDVQKSQSFQLSNKIQKDRLAQLPKLFGTISEDWMSNPDTELEHILVEANKLNLDPAAVVAVYAIESNFGKVKGVKTKPISAKDAVGALQITPATAKSMLEWFVHHEQD